MVYQLIAFDMDGTLLRSDQTIDPESCQAIARAQVAGKTVVLATGRAISELKTYLPDLSGVRYGVLASGGLIYDFETEEILVKKSLPDHLLGFIKELLTREEVLVLAMRDGQAYLQTGHLDQLEAFYLGHYRQLYTETASLIPSLIPLLDQGGFEKINLYFKSKDQRAIQAQRLAQQPLSLVFAEETGLELSAVGADKGSALTCLCQLLAIDMSEVIGVGDADNDLTMFEQVGLGLAMGNANDAIKSLAGAVLPDNNHGGCSLAIDTYLLGNGS